MPLDPFADLLKDTRHMLELDRGHWNETAAAAGVSHNWLSKFARDLIPNPGIDTVSRVWCYLDKKYPYHKVK
jgi:hypothetical protein